MIAKLKRTLSNAGQKKVTNTKTTETNGRNISVPSTYAPEHAFVH